MIRPESHDMRRNKVSSDQSDKMDELANDLDDIKTTVDELEEDPPAGVEKTGVHTLRRTLEKAGDLADDLSSKAASGSTAPDADRTPK